MSHFQAKIPNAKIGLGKALTAKWVEIDKAATGGPKIIRKVTGAK